MQVDLLIVSQHENIDRDLTLHGVHMERLYHVVKEEVRGQQSPPQLSSNTGACGALRRPAPRCVRCARAMPGTMQVCGPCS